MKIFSPNLVYRWRLQTILCKFNIKVTGQRSRSRDWNEILFGPYLCNQWRFHHKIWSIGEDYKQYYANLVSRSQVKGQRSSDWNEILFWPYLCNIWKFSHQIWCIGRNNSQHYANLISRSQVKSQGHQNYPSADSYLPLLMQ